MLWPGMRCPVGGCFWHSGFTVMTFTALIAHSWHGSFCDPIFITPRTLQRSLKPVLTYVGEITWHTWTTEQNSCQKLCYLQICLSTEMSCVLLWSRQKSKLSLKSLQWLSPHSLDREEEHREFIQLPLLAKPQKQRGQMKLILTFKHCLVSEA